MAYDLGAESWTFAPTELPGYRCPAGTEPDTDNAGNVICRDSAGSIFQPIRTGVAGAPARVAAAVERGTGIKLGSLAPMFLVLGGVGVLFVALRWLKKRKKGRR